MSLRSELVWPSSVRHTHSHRCHTHISTHTVPTLSPLRHNKQEEWPEMYWRALQDLNSGTALPVPQPHPKFSMEVRVWGGGGQGFV